MIRSTSSTTLRSKNDSIARYEPNSTTIATAGGRIRNQTMTASAAIEQPDAERRPRLAERPAARDATAARARTRGGGGARGSSSSPARRAASRSLAGRDRRAELDLLRSQAAASRASPSWSSSGPRRAIVVEAGCAADGRHLRVELRQRDRRAPRPRPRPPLARSSAPSIRASRTGPPATAARPCRARRTRAGRATTGGPCRSGCTSARPGRARRRTGRRCRGPTGRGSGRPSRRRRRSMIGVQSTSPPGPTTDAVAAGVVDERDAERALASVPARSPGSGWSSVSRQTRRSRSSGPRMFRSPGNGSSMMYSPRSR